MVRLGFEQLLTLESLTQNAFQLDYFDLYDKLDCWLFSESISSYSQYLQLDTYTNTCSALPAYLYTCSCIKLQIKYCTNYIACMYVCVLLAPLLYPHWSLVHNMTLVPQASQASRKKIFFHQSNCIPDVKFFNNLIGWMLANACDATLE